jgi:hypothetical protein
MRYSVLFTVGLFLAGCASAPRLQLPRGSINLPADGFITQRGVLTVFGGKQFTLNGYLATSATNGHRLVITENFGNVLADVLIQRDGSARVMKSSAAFKEEWIERYIAEDVRCMVGLSSATDCPGRVAGTNRYVIERRWYKLDLQTLNTKIGAQPIEMFAVPSVSKP